MSWDKKATDYQNKIKEIDAIEKTGKKARDELSKQGKLGAFYTPNETIVFLTNNAFGNINLLDLNIKSPHELKILEPSVGIGSFIPVIIELLLPLYQDYYKNDNSFSLKGEKARIFFIESIFRDNLYLCDIDEDVIPLLKDRLYDILGHKNFNDFNIIIGNFLELDFEGLKFDIILGNPPYGVDVNSKMEKDISKRTLSGIDKKFDKRYGYKIKKESYCYFIVHSIELLKNNGVLSFITSDTFLTLGTFLGLRNFMLEEGKILDVSMAPKNLFAPFTTYPTASFTFIKGQENKDIELRIINTKESYISGEQIDSKKVSIKDISIFPNKSFYYNSYTKENIYLFNGNQTIGDVLRLVGGFTTGNNKKFLEDYNPGKHDELIGKKYEFYNKSMPGIRWFSEPKHVIQWENDGQNILDYKKSTGKWYLGGMGGKKDFFKEGITINLISSKINARYIPPNKYIFDAGVLMGILKDEKTNINELYFLLGYLNSNIATKLLKNVLNHTKNIQSSNISLLPYPNIDTKNKNKIINLVKENIENYKNKELLEKNTITINNLFKINQLY